MSAFQVLLYYKFVRVNDPNELACQQLELCREFGLKGRIIVAEEGINGTLSGKTEDTQKYIEAMQNDPRFEDMEYKIDEHHEHVFKRLSVKARDETITMGYKLADHRVGQYLSPKQWREMLDRDDVLIIDGRNDYEYELGHFRNAIRPGFENFKEATEWIESNIHADKKQPILTYCTGGIRCEKLSAVLLENGFENVFQLQGGIVTYGKDEQVKGDLFDGQCFVFDERIAVSINRTDSAKVVAHCKLCGALSENYVNCANVLCNELFICCEACEQQYDRCCSQECRQSETRREKGQKLRKRDAVRS